MITIIPSYNEEEKGGKKVSVMIWGIKSRLSP